MRLFVVVLALAGNGAWAASHGTLMLSADVRGYLAPCGCNEHMRGGIAKLAHAIEAARAQGTSFFYVDGGNSLFDEHLPTPEAEVREAEQRARTLAEIMRALRLSARAVGSWDDARGKAFRRSLGLPDIRPGQSARLGKTPVAIAVGGSPDELLEGARRARDGGSALVVGLATFSWEDAVRSASALAPSLDVVVVGHSPGDLSAEVSRQVQQDELSIVQLASKGRALLRLEFLLEGDARPRLLTTGESAAQEVEALTKRLALYASLANDPGVSSEKKVLLKKKSAELVQRRTEILARGTPELSLGTFSLRRISVESSLPESPRIAAMVEKHDRQVGAANVMWARQHPTPCPTAGVGEADYVGSDACASCHEEASAVFMGTPHANAYATLKEKRKQHHLECIRCHVTGWQAPGGVCDVVHIAGRTSVGCESCHGPGSLHLLNPTAANIRRRMDKRLCVSCHDPENSPHFEWEKYLPLILGPGHTAQTREAKTR
ncbi:MAG: multiheme c-type cytochrome [Myxococcaceae bacterium]